MKFNELWKDIPNYEGLYQVSNLGKIKSLDRYVNGRNSKRLIKGKILSLVKEKDGYLVVNLYKNNATKQFRVHRIVAEVFLLNPDNLPEVNHKDEDKINNIVITLNGVMLNIIVIMEIEIEKLEKKLINMIWMGILLRLGIVLFKLKEN